MQLGAFMLFYFARMAAILITYQICYKRFQADTDSFSHSVVELNIAIIVCSVPGLAKFLKTFEWQWSPFRSLRSKFSSSQKLTHSPGSSGKHKSASLGSTPDQVAIAMQPNTASKHPSTVYGADLSQHDRDRSCRSSVGQTSQVSEASTTEFEHIYNSWDLDPYLDCAGTRHSILYAGNTETHAKRTESLESV